MPRKPKDENYYLKNCYRCKHFHKTWFVSNGRSDGLVSYKCAISDEDVQPWHIDGCKNYDEGTPTEVYKEVKSKGETKK